MMKTNIYNTNNRELTSRDWMCCCCGARAVTIKPNNKKVFHGTSRLIRVAVGDFNDGQSFDNGKQTIDVIQTKNGPITIGTRYVW